ncbi:AraC family transcriptional regulator [Cereibacter sphaeroides]|uniref:helix-turn-helix transcriptional regulator n=1 Tax=Rhodobacterales TaxID=204455 RepID=UPI000BBEFE3C|nr:MULTISPECIES: AraC family transcriptional regulator [Paracoccaceae]MCE6953195.1 AraC family transcriptional regulator [Cereibacter sphaeroides]
MSESSSPATVRLVAIPRLAAGGRWRVEAMRSVSEPLLLWFTRGQGRITVAGITRGYTAHNAIFIPSGVMHGFEVGPQTFGTAVFFAKGCDLPLPAQPQHLRIREALVQQELNVMLDTIARELEGRAPASDRAVWHHLGLLSVWLERQAARLGPVEPVDATRRLVARFTALLERDFRSGMGVAHFAGMLGVTPTHLSRCCRQTCGRPASALLHDRVIFEARRLLSETDLPVNRIAESLGFTSPAYFTRAFGHLTGQSPSAFRRAS